MHEKKLEGREAATCGIVDLEIFYSARNQQELKNLRLRRSFSYYRVPITDGTFDRAADIQVELAKTGRHRIPIPDLIIAGAASAAGLTVLHYDSDYDRIAEVTEQPMEWVVAQGSI